MKKLWVFLILMGIVAVTKAQSLSADSVKTKVRRYTARNFSEERSFNLYWETAPRHDYTLKREGQTIESGRTRSEHTVKFSTVIPLVDKKRFSLNVKGNADFHKFEVKNDLPDATSIIYKGDDDTYSYYKLELNASYTFNLFRRPLILRAAISGDGWNKGVEKMDGSFTALYMLKNSECTSFYVGIYFMMLFDRVPAIPLFIYSHQFSPSLRVDLSLPSRAFLRWQFANSHRLSLGGMIDGNQFYYRPETEGLPKTALFKTTNLKVELDYEYIINKHFYLIVRGGAARPFKSGFYKTNRKGDGDGDPLLEYMQPLTPFFYFGFSYNIWK